MRDDIAKLICERPRSGQDGGVHARIHRRRLNRLDGETDIKHESMSRRRGYVKYGGVWYYVRFKLFSTLLARPQVVGGDVASFYRWQLVPRGRGAPRHVQA